MASIVSRLTKEGLIKPPHFVVSNTVYECLMGSEAYGIASNTSDIDVYGFCFPTKELVFPHLAGEIPGFGRQIQRFEQYSQHHIQSSNGKEYDVAIYSIVKYFQLCMENNPNMLDSLFVPRRCVLTSSPVAEMVREKRKMFLHKGAYFKHKGYAYSQLNKIRNKTNSSNPKRKAVIDEVGYDTKFATHLCRLILQAEMILVEEDLDIERNREQLKSIRRGEWTLEEVENFFAEKEKSLEALYSTSKLRAKPDEAAIKQLLMDCLEHHYGSLSQSVVVPAKAEQALQDIKAILAKNGVI